MPKRILIRPHLTVEELYARYRQATDPVERSHFHIIWLLAQGNLTRTVTDVTGYCAIWIQKLARRYNAAGPAGLRDRRRQQPGGTPLLSPALQAELCETLQAPPPDGGLWTGTKVAAWMSAHLGRPVRFQRGVEYLHRLGYSLQRPRPRHRQADPAAQAAFKQTLPARWRPSSKPIRPTPSKSGPRTSSASA